MRNNADLRTRKTKEGGMMCAKHNLPVIGMHSLYPTERFPNLDTKRQLAINGLAAIPMCRECRL